MCVTYNLNGGNSIFGAATEARGVVNRNGFVIEAAVIYHSIILGWPCREARERRARSLIDRGLSAMIFSSRLVCINVNILNKYSIYIEHII